MRTLCLTGWGQPHDALAGVAPNATHLDYAHAQNASEAMQMIAAQKAECVVGWSLGGQLAVQAIAAGLMMPKRLVLVAVPYQFVAGDAMGPETFQKFVASYAKQPHRTLHKAWELLHYEDARSDYIGDQLAAFDKDAVLAKDWLRWLFELEHFTCDALDFSAFPPVLLVHGTRDKVVEHTQSERMKSRLQTAKLELWEGCGHAPHLHDATRLTRLISEFSYV